MNDMIDTSSDLRDLISVDFQEQAINEDGYLDQSYEDRFELPCMADYQ